MDFPVEVTDVVDHVCVLEEVKDGKFKVVISPLRDVFTAQLVFKERENKVSVHMLDKFRQEGIFAGGVVDRAHPFLFCVGISSIFGRGMCAFSRIWGSSSGV